MTIETQKFDPAEYLDTREDVIEYLNLAIEHGDPRFVQHALGTVSRAKGMAEIAQEIGVGRESLYKSLSAEGNPSWQTMMKVLGALGLRLQITEIAA